MANINNSIPVFNIKGKGWIASGQMVEDGFVIFEGSTVAPVAECFTKQKSYYNCRIMCEKDEVIVDGKFVRDFCFKSAAQAASVVSGRLANVNHQLKTEDGKTFGECYPKRMGKKRELVVKEEKKEDAVPMGESVMEDGTPRLVEERDGMIIESRGNLAKKVA